MENDDPMLTKTQRLVLGFLVLILVDVIWVSSSELTKFIYKNETFEKPFFCTYIKTSMFTLYLLGFLFWPSWKDSCSKPSNYIYLQTEDDDDNYITDANCGSSLSNPVYVPVKTPERENWDRSSGTESDDSTWFIANYTYQVALSETEAGIVNVLSSTSSLFTLVLASIFPSNPSDKFTLSKLVAVFLSIIGIVLVSFSDLTIESKLPFGAVLSLFSAFFYATYLVFLKRKVDHEDKIGIPLFFGFVGLFNLLLLWPLFFFLHFSKLEIFEWPTREQLLLLLLNGLLGTVISEALWLWGCFLTSSLMATVAMSLTIPMTMLADVLLKEVPYPILFYTGTLPVLVAFLAVTVLSHYENWDPVFDILQCAYQNVCKKSRFIRSRFKEAASEQTEALIGINSCEHEA
uniref:Solute carrier family 35 member F5 n=1 Tax=Diabrotica virgifera virgifera TaxID=50390 RepID=A0A6P7FML2_DIAVI